MTTQEMIDVIQVSKAQYSNWIAESNEQYTRFKQKETVSFGNGYKRFVDKYENKYTYYFNAPKACLEREGVTYHKKIRTTYKDKMIYDGERSYQYNIVQKHEKDIATPTCSVISGYGIGYQGNIIELSYSLTGFSWDTEVIIRYPLDMFIAGKTKAGKVAQIEDEYINGTLCDVFVSGESNGVICKVWVAPKYMYSVLKSEITTKNEVIVTNNQYDVIGNTCYLKESIEENIERPSGVKLSTRTLTIISFDNNPIISDSTFVMDFPEGLEVLRFDLYDFIPRIPR